jgi:hypothetical protein
LKWRLGVIVLGSRDRGPPRRSLPTTDETCGLQERSLGCSHRGKDSGLLWENSRRWLLTPLTLPYQYLNAVICQAELQPASLATISPE